MNYSVIKEYDIANGPGCRTTLFVSGCRNHCEGCFQPETWDFSCGTVYGDETKQRILDSLEADYVSGLTLLGGEPFEEENQGPLTDLVEVKVPDEIGFNVSVKYWINTSDSPKAVSIQTQVAAAVSGYVEWQSAEMGRDINPSQLSGLVMDAGAKRCEVTLPVFTEVPEWAVARALDVTVVYGGLEDD